MDGYLAHSSFVHIFINHRRHDREKF